MPEGNNYTGSAQWYISAPNDVAVCIDRLAGRRITGRLYHRYSTEAIPFLTGEQVVYRMEELFDRLRFPPVKEPLAARNGHMLPPLPYRSVLWTTENY